MRDCASLPVTVILVYQLFMERAVLRGRDLAPNAHRVWSRPNLDQT
jgi:hypothetical protein